MKTPKSTILIFIFYILIQGINYFMETRKYGESVYQSRTMSDHDGIEKRELKLEIGSESIGSSRKTKWRIFIFYKNSNFKLIQKQYYHLIQEKGLNTRF